LSTLKNVILAALNSDGLVSSIIFVPLILAFLLAELDNTLKTAYLQPVIFAQVANIVKFVK